jgi:hypothetical protein
MYQVSRVYKNSTEDIIRVDTISMLPTGTPKNLGVTQGTFYRSVKTERYYEGGVSRTVNAILLVTSADSVDYDVSAAANYNWAEWTTEKVRCNMSDLPQIGDTV